jgi:hypothetical protein
MVTRKQIEAEAAFIQRLIREAKPMVKIFTLATVPPELANAWLQHLRDFDTAHPGCRFEVMADLPEQPLMEMVQMLRVNPALSFTAVFSRKPGPEK